MEGPGTFENPGRCQFPLRVSKLGLKKELSVHTCALSSPHVTLSQEGGGMEHSRGSSHRGSWLGRLWEAGEIDAHTGAQEIHRKRRDVSIGKGREASSKRTGV